MHKAYLGILLFALTACWASPASGQVTLGIRGGVNISNASVTEGGQEPTIPYESRTGLLFGATLGVDVTSWLSLQMGAQYSQEGTKQDDGTTSGLVRLSYVAVPVVGKVHMTREGSRVRPYLLAGGSVGFETGCTVRAEGPVEVETDCDAIGVGLKGTDPRAVVGGGADVPVGRATFTMDVEYSLGLRNIATDHEVDAKSRVLSIAFGFKVSPWGKPGP